ncbi:MAG: RsmB/NOP family class I SAM-dependent RNA methyltransferase [Gemmatimonadetes bacterium]|nr:RsmB/NOP family class I SAM-dependent RNA methyltransferase [Gemmatimonadota bacterium]
MLSPCVHRGLDSLDPKVLELLRLGAYQLLYMGSVPTYAAVSESVAHAGTVAGKGAGGLVNAVLRCVADAGDGAELFPDPALARADYLATWGSHPRWLVDRWLARWPGHVVEALVTANNARRALFLVPLEHPAPEAVARLAAAGIESTEVGFGTDCVELEPGSSPLAALRALPQSIVQDPAARLVSQYTDVGAGTKVADLCAAPGGKALAVAGRASFTLAADRSESRMRMIRENMDRTGQRLGCVVADALHPPITRADVVLLDVPCTGTGTFARHPDARWRLTPSSVHELAGLQEELLRAAGRIVSPGGLLVYSTCALEPEENEEQIDAFLVENGDFHVEATEAVHARFLDDRGRLVVNPHETGFDGAFAARLRRST